MTDKRTKYRTNRFHCRQLSVCDFIFFPRQHEQHHKNVFSDCDMNRHPIKGIRLQLWLSIVSHCRSGRIPKHHEDIHVQDKMGLATGKMELTAAFWNALNTMAQIQEQVWFSSFLFFFFILEFRQTLRYLCLTQQLLKKNVKKICWQWL